MSDQELPEEVGFTGFVGALVEAIKQLDARLEQIESKLDDE